MAPLAPLVFTTGHVIERVAERCPGVEDPAATVVAEVSAALVEGRRSARKPRALVRRGRPRPRVPAGAGVLRYIWPPDGSRVYLCRRVRRAEDGLRGWLVLTVLLPRLPHGYELEDDVTAFGAHQPHRTEGEDHGF